MSQSKSLKSTVLIWLLIFATELSGLGCNSSNHSSKQLLPGKDAKLSTQSKRTAAVAPVATRSRTAKRHTAKKAGGFGETLNGLGKTFEGAAKLTCGAAVVAGTVVGSLFLNYQVWRLQDKMF